jgi:hypothetical protein
MDEFSEEHFQLEAGAWLAGYDIGSLLKEFSELKNYILQILKRETEQQIGKISRYYYNKAYFEDIVTIQNLFNLS